MHKSLKFLAIIFVSLNLCAGSAPDSRNVIKTIRDSFSCRKNNPGLSVAIVKDGQIVYANGFGVQSLESRKPVTKDTLFGIASLTKAFTSTLLAKLTDGNSNYSLNTQIAEFYGNSPVFDGYFRSKFASIKDLLSHRMGIPMHNFIRFDNTLTRRNLIRRLKVLRPRGRFRDSFYYSNIMYGQAARIAEKIGKRSYEDLIKDELFVPIGMTQSDFFTTANESEIEYAQGYLDVYGEVHPVPFELSKKWSELCGANCILSSAVDMGKWMMFQLSHGKNQDNKRVIRKDALEDTHKPENVLTQSSTSKYFTKPNVPETFSQTGYALGWRTGHYRGYNMLTHTGSSWGYKNMITMYPDMNLGIYTAMSGDDEDFYFRYSLHQYLSDMYLGETPWLNATTICSFPSPWFPERKSRTKPNISTTLKPQRTLDEYLGVYENPAYGKIEMFILDEPDANNKLIAEFGYVDMILYPKATKDEFYFETDGIAAKLINFGTVQFKEERGVITKMRIPTFEPKDPPIFKRTQIPQPIPTEPTIPDVTTTSRSTAAKQTVAPTPVQQTGTGIPAPTEPTPQTQKVVKKSRRNKEKVVSQDQKIIDIKDQKDKTVPRKEVLSVESRLEDTRKELIVKNTNAPATDPIPSQSITTPVTVRETTVKVVDLEKSNSPNEADPKVITKDSTRGEQKTSISTEPKVPIPDKTKNQETSVKSPDTESVPAQTEPVVEAANVGTTKEAPIEKPVETDLVRRKTRTKQRSRQS